MNNFTLMFLYGLVILISWIGMGRLVAIALRKRHGLAKDLGLGLASMLIVGGILNIAHAITSWSLTALLLVGIASFIFTSISARKSCITTISGLKPRKAKDWFWIAIFVMIVMTSLVRYAAYVAPGTYNGHDDYQGYFVFAEKIIQTGSIGADPYSERRLVSSVGGQSFLHSFILMVGDYRNLALMDSGIGYLAFMLIMAAVLLQFGLSRFQSAAILGMAIILPAPVVNITAFYTGSALFLVLLQLMKEDYEANTRQIVPLTMVLCGLLMLKNSFAVPGAVFFICYLLATATKRGWRAAFDIAWKVALSALPLMAAWLIASYASSGTAYYPLLGRGFHGSVYGDFPMASDGFSWKEAILDVYSSGMFLMALALAAFSLLHHHLRTRLEFLGTGMAACMVVSMALIAFATGGYALNRYSYPFVISTIIFLLAWLISDEPKEDANHDVLCFMAMLIGILSNDIGPMFMRLGHAVVVLTVIIVIASLRLKKTLMEGLLLAARYLPWMIIGILLLTGARYVKTDWRIISNRIKCSVRHCDIIPPPMIGAMNAAQGAVPPGEPMLVRMNANFLFDFRRNPIYIADYPGGSSLPPGLPFKKGSEAMADYLIGSGIRYVAYSYALEGGFSYENFKDRLEPGINLWVRTEAEHAFDFQDNLRDLGTTRRRVYDDGEIFVLDLATRL
jgi:hypothetical protein